MQSYIDGPYKTFTAEVAGALNGKEGYAVEQVPGTGNIQLHNAGLAIGALFQRLQGSDDWVVRLYGKGGTMKVVQGAVNTPIGSRVKSLNGKHVATAVAGDRTLGIKVGPVGNGADNDVMEIDDVVEKV